MSVLYTVDRFEGVAVVLENDAGERFQVPRTWLPVATQEGDVLRVNSDPDGESGAGTVHLDLAPDVRSERLADAKQRRDRIPRGPKGDLSL